MTISAKTLGLLEAKKLNVNSYKATVIATFCNGRVEHTTYVGGRSAEEAKATLEREGFEVLGLWLLELAA